MRELEDHGIDVVVYDPLAGTTALEELGLKVARGPFGTEGLYDGMVLAVPHKAFRETPIEAYANLLREDGGLGVLVDVRGLWRGEYPNRDLLYWSL